MVIKVANMILTVLAGIGAALVLFWVINKLTELLPGKWEQRVKPYVFIAPAFLSISLFLLYPAVQTIVYSFANSASTAWVGLDNYTNLLTANGFQQTLINTVLWIVIAPAVTIIFGLAVAVLADRLSPRGEKLSKTIIFLPMAISAVGAATVWRFVYEYAPPGQPQVGLQNAIISAFGADPIPWLEQRTLRLNTLLLIVMFLWAQIGFSMVLLSAAIKAVPTETIEAGRIDGATERQIFRRVVLPQIRNTIITVFVTVTIGVMKLFDIVYVMTNGNYNTNVIAVEFFNQLLTNFNTGAAAAVVVMLMLAVVPIMIYQVRHFKAEEAAR